CRNRFQGSGLSLPEVNRKVLSFSRGWLDCSLEKLPILVKDDDINQRIKSYIDSQFKDLDRETFKKQLKEAMNTMTCDYETGVKKGRQLSVIRPIGRADELKRLS
ncbi:MAG: transcriptional regulator, partial [Enterovibrio sp.]